MELNENAVTIAVRVLKNDEGCNLIAYPDPESELYKALSTHNMLRKYMAGVITWDVLPENFKLLSGKPWTCGFGETNDVTKNTVYTQQEADSKLEARVRMVMTKCLEDCPKLVLEHPERIAAITSMTYNIGNHAFAESTACKLITEDMHQDVANAIMLWNKPSSIIPRRQIEANLWNSVRS